MTFHFSDFRMDFRSLMEKLQQNGKLLLITCFSIIILMVLICVIVFFLALRGSEEVMVPNITGKELSTALLELQAKELYPKIQLRFSDHPDEKGTILEQTPAPGAIVKAGRRINLIISRGAIIDRVESYIGQNVDEVKVHLQSLFTSTSRPLIVLSEPPLYQFDPSPAGTILQQNPPPDTEISDPVRLELVVSRGPQNNTVKVPNLLGLSVNDTMLLMSRSKVVFDFSSRPPNGQEIPGTIVSQLPAEASAVNAYSRVAAVFAFPVEPNDGIIYGIFTRDLPAYPYPLRLKFEALTPDGERYQLTSFDHPGGSLTVPYAVPEDTVLILSIMDNEASRYTVTPEMME
ncbi:MAG: PASTA domain-containing protein [Spirochaetaceae bacterium]|jgi:beta-lactam-binding protein with PASTA domain|nr:PASTA domain-containing protein [Spirochaetaceae bacterium]